MSQHAYTLPYEHLEDLMTNFILTESLQALLLSMGMSYTHMPLKEYRHLFLKKNYEHYWPSIVTNLHSCLSSILP